MKEAIYVTTVKAPIWGSLTSAVPVLTHTLGGLFSLTPPFHLPLNYHIKQVVIGVI